MMSAQGNDTPRAFVTTRNLFRFLILAALVVGCGAPITSTPPPAPTVKVGFVSRATYGDDWPFSVPSGTLACYPSGNNELVTFNTGDGIEYALNGQARDFGFPDLDATILPSWPDASMLGDLIAQGLALCE